VTLHGILPPIWRRLLVPGDYTFWDLHVAIQDAMGWLDYHLHEFAVPGPQGRTLRIGIPHDDEFIGEEPPRAGWEIPIARYLDAKRNRATYLYDFGDGWTHRLLVEAVTARPAGTQLPVCLAGRRQRPPEDVGGLDGYEEFLRAIADPEHEEHDSYLEWVGGSFDPESFDPRAVEFTDPDWRLHFAFDE
jgi:hypothetical protein